MNSTSCLSFPILLHKTSWFGHMCTQYWSNVHTYITDDDLCTLVRVKTFNLMTAKLQSILQEV